jgi:hypothetical protein
MIMVPIQNQFDPDSSMLHSMPRLRPTLTVSTGQNAHDTQNSNDDLFKSL